MTYGRLTFVLSLVSAVGTAAITHDFGDVVRGLNYTNAFVITNGSGASCVRITRVRSLCDCVKAVRYDESIAPGGTGEVVLVLETAKLYGKVRYVTMVELVSNALVRGSAIETSGKDGHNPRAPFSNRGFSGCND